MGSQDTNVIRGCYDIHIEYMFSQYAHFIGKCATVMPTNNINNIGYVLLYVLITIFKGSLQGLQGLQVFDILGHFCAHTGYIGPGESPEDDEMNEMTLSSKHRARNSNPGGLRPSTLSLGHGGSP